MQSSEPLLPLHRGL